MHKDLISIAAGFITENKSLVHAESDKVFTQNDIGALTSFLYQHYYLRAAPTDRSLMSLRSIKEQEDTSITSAYYKAVEALTYPDNGWIKISGKANLFHKDGVTLRVETGQAWPQGNDSYHLKMPCARPYASPGFFSCCSTAGPLLKGTPFNRIYFNNKQKQVSEIFIKIIHWVNDHTLPLIIKAGNNWDTLRRPDSLVAYVQRDTFSQLRTAIQGWSIDANVTEPTGPAFTKALAEGFYWAEDAFPFGTSGLSFGKHRCQVTANGMLAVLAKNGTPADGIDEAWKHAGLNPTEPHLAPSSI